MLKKRMIGSFIALIIAVVVLVGCAKNKSGSNEGTNGKENMDVLVEKDNNDENTEQDGEKQTPEVIDFTGIEPAPASDFVYMYFHYSEEEGWDYHVDDGITGVDIWEYSGNAEIVVIPDMIDGFPVKSVGFGKHEELKGVKIPEGVEEIRDNAFDGCSSLITAELPSTLKVIGMEAFHRCALTTLKLPEGLEKIDKFAFKYNDLTELTIPSTVSLIEVRAFEGNMLKSLIIEDGETELKIYSSAFNYFCGEYLTIPDRVIYLGDHSIMPGSQPIRCTAGSAAEEYAKRMEYEYEIIE